MRSVPDDPDAAYGDRGPTLPTPTGGKGADGAREHRANAGASRSKRFERRLSLGVAAILLAFVPAIAVALYSLSAMISSQQELNDRFARTLVLAQALRSEKIRQNAAMPVFVIDGDPGSLTDLAAANGAFDAAMAELTGIEMPAPQREVLSRIGELQSRLRAIAEPGIAMRKDGRSADEVNAYFRKEAGPVTDRVLSELASFVELTRQAYEERRALDDRSFRFAFHLLAAGCIVSTLLALGAALMLVRLVQEKRASDDEREREAQAEQAVSTSRKEAIETVAHELKNPLSAILMATEHVLLRGGLPKDGKVHRMLEIVLASATSMNLVILNVLDHAKIESRVLTLDRMEIDVGVMLERLVTRFEVIANEKEIRLVNEVRPGPPILHIDPVRIEQVFSNLLGNAFKFTPRGGTITLTASPGTGGMTFAVVDTGCGMPPDQAAQVFDRYWQARGGAAKGTGLGLAISKAIVDAHGGILSVESAVGEGSTFRMTLPYAPPAGPGGSG